MSKAQGKFDFSVHHPFKTNIWDAILNAHTHLLTTDDRSTLIILRSCELIGWSPATDSWTDELLYRNPRSQSPLNQ